MNRPMQVSGATSTGGLDDQASQGRTSDYRWWRPPVSGTRVKAGGVCVIGGTARPGGLSAGGVDVIGDSARPGGLVTRELREMLVKAMEATMGFKFPIFRNKS